MSKQSLYRFELAPSGRAKCQTAECKKSGEKIPLHSLRVGSFVELNVGQFWSWRHWGCTTPRMLESIHNAWVENCKPGQPDPEMLDGFNELPPEMQEKVLRALENGHIDDSDWKGDPEKNVPGARGFRNLPTKTRKKTNDSEINENEDSNEVSVKKEPCDSPPLKNESDTRKRSPTPETNFDESQYVSCMRTVPYEVEVQRWEEARTEAKKLREEKKQRREEKEQCLSKAREENSRRNPKRACRKSTTAADTSPSPAGNDALEKTPKDAYVPKSKTSDFRPKKKDNVGGNASGRSQRPSVYLE